MTHISPIEQRLRITFGKYEALKYTGNLDVAKIWERALRRAKLPILYTKGFNTRPRLQLASALPLGITSECEILDVALREMIALDGLAERILAVSPRGLRIYSIAEVEPHGPALQTLVRSAEYRIRFDDDLGLDLLQERIDSILAAENLPHVREKKGKRIVRDLRPLILDLRLDDEGSLIAHLAVGDRGNIRPDEVLAEMQVDSASHHVHRFCLHLQ